jgi:hypothetical protein
MRPECVLNQRMEYSFEACLDQVTVQEENYSARNPDEERNH